MPKLTIHGNTLDPDSEHGPAFPSDASGTDFIILETANDLLPNEKRELQARQLTIQELIRPGNPRPAYLCRYERSDLGALEALPFVEKAFVYHNDFVVDPQLKASTSDLVSNPNVLTKPLDDQDGDSTLVRVQVSLHANVAAGGHDVLDQLKAKVPESQIECLLHDSNSLELWVPPNALPILAELDDVYAVHPAVDDELETVRQRALIDAPALQLVNVFPPGALIAQGRFLGDGQTVAVCDSGFNFHRTPTKANEHKAFKSTGAANSAWRYRVQPDLPPEDGEKSHGTHVAGIVAGMYSEYQSMSPRSTAVGIAPEASVYIQSRKSGTVADRCTLLLAQKPSITIQNNSWGNPFPAAPPDPTPLPYAPKGRDVDLALDADMTRTMLLVFSAGNDGNQLAHQAAGPRLVNVQSGNSKAAKNIIVVGASWSDRVMRQVNAPMVPGPSVETRYDELDCVAGLRPPIRAADRGHENSDCVISYSNKGPTVERFLRPHVIAPGCGILSTWNTNPTMQGQKPSGTDANSCQHPMFGYKTGTSMAAPVVSGLAACIKQAYVHARMRVPRATSLKAVIINAAVSCQGGNFWYVENVAGVPTTRRDTLGRTPDNVQGYGRVSYSRSLDHVTPPVGPLPHAGVEEGTILEAHAIGYTPREVPFQLDPLRPRISATLVWHEPAAAQIQLNLSILVEIQKRGPANALHVLASQGPDQPQAYASFPTGGDAASPDPPVSLGNVQRVTMTAAPPPLGVGETLWAVARVSAGAFATNAAQAYYSVAWYTEA